MMPHFYTQLVWAVTSVVCECVGSQTSRERLAEEMRGQVGCLSHTLAYIGQHFMTYICKSGAFKINAWH